MKKTQLLLLLLSAISFEITAQTYLNIKKYDGQNQYALISSVRKLTFSEESDTVQFVFKSAPAVTHGLVGIQNVTFSNTGSGILIDVEKGNPGSPQRMVLLQNYPNPFNPATAISFIVPERGHVSLKVYDILGNELITLLNEEHAAGQYTKQFDARTVPSGVYFYKLTTGSVSLCKKMIVLK
ncbi:MAG: T9SS type A sorting domain-containing protein [Ignavibacteriales bacterium]|nr:T9SS type A sorting domain-containing protein [Ignavibacteriales bacterium]